jgi:PKD repeat protein
MTYDVADGYVVLFGGLSASGYPTNDTWAFESGAWKNITSTAGPGPSARSGMAMTYDSADGYVLAFGGSASQPCSNLSISDVCNDTWSFSAGKWHRIAAVGAPAVDYFSNGMELSLVFDTADSYVVLTNGFETWKYTAGTWSPFCGTNCTNFVPGPDLWGTAVYDAPNGSVLFLGSQYPSGGYPTGSYTWTFSAGKWTNITATAGISPPARIFGMMAYDSSTSSVLVFGGFGGNRSKPILQPVNDTWSFQGGTWQEVATNSSPPVSAAGSVSDDLADSVVVLFGGAGETAALNDTWVWGTSPPIAEVSIHVSPSIPMPGNAALFSATFKGGVGPFTYSWQFGDGGSSALASPPHTFSTAGYYLVELWVNDSAGHATYATTQVHVYVELGITGLQANPNPASLDQEVNFSASAEGGTPPYAYSWAFGDGGVGGNSPNITHIYTTNGPFVAEVTVTDSVGEVVHAYLNVSIRLQALAGSTATSGNPPFSVTFIGQVEGGVPPYQYDWDFGDGTPTSTLQDPLHRYNVSGNYLVDLTVTDSKGNQSVSSLTVRVGSTPGGSPLASYWIVGFAVATVVAVVAALGWVVDRSRLRTRRLEGEQWIEELTAIRESDDAIPPR